MVYMGSAFNDQNYPWPYRNPIITSLDSQLILSLVFPWRPIETTVTGVFCHIQNIWFSVGHFLSLLPEDPQEVYLKDSFAPQEP
jgi:hypothetical protein